MPEDVAKYVGPEHAAVRKAMSRTARALMRSKRRCEALPEAAAGFRALANASYPRWFTASFLAVPQTPAQYRPCAQP